MKITIVEENSEKQVSVDKGSTVEEVLKDLNKNPSEYLTSVNDTITSKKHEIEEGDRIELLDVIAGG